MSSSYLLLEYDGVEMISGLVHLIGQMLFGNAILTFIDDTDRLVHR